MDSVLRALPDRREALALAGDDVRLVLGLIISESLQQAMIDNDDSMTNAFVSS